MAQGAAVRAVKDPPTPIKDPFRPAPHCDLAGKHRALPTKPK
jgi:hypothetical protein